MRFQSTPFIRRHHINVTTVLSCRACLRSMDFKVYLKPKSRQLKYKLQRKYGSKDQIQIVEHCRVLFRLLVELHGQSNRIDHNQYKNRVLEWLRGHEPPHFILDSMFWNVPSNRFCLQSKLYAISLVFIQIAILILLFSFVLESHDNEADKDIDHEESNDDDIDDVVNSHNRSKVMNWSAIFSLRID